MNPETKKVTVELVGGDGNAFVIIAAVRKALTKAGFKEEADNFVKAARECKDYDALLVLVQDIVEVE